MPWSSPVGAVELRDSTGVSLGFVAATSTATVNLYEADPPAGDRLRMFGLSDGQVRDSMDSTKYPWNTSDSWSSVTSPPPTPLDLDAATGVDYPRLYYIDSIDDGFGVQRFILQDPGGAGPGPLVTTVIPSARQGVEDWAYTMVYYGSASPAADYPSGTIIRRSGAQDTIWLVRNQLAKWDVGYKDPYIVNLGAGVGWLMLLSRTRKTSGEGGGNGPDECLSDIVAYWSTEDEPDFEDKDKVTGPYWIGVNIGTLGGETSGVRFWLSVPTGAMISPTELMVYFVCERTAYPGGVSFDAMSSVDAVFDGLAPLDRTGAATFQSCLVGHRIALSDLDAMRSATPPLYGHEDEWALSSSGGKYRVPKISRGIVYLWKDDGSGAPGGDLVDESDYLKIADPACARCSLDETTIGMFEYVRLFVAGNVRSGTHAEAVPDMWAPRGLWYSRAIGEGTFSVTRRDGSSDKTHAGYDFLLGTASPFIAASQAATSVVESTMTVEQVVIDPDPVEFADGTWRVAFGVTENPHSSSESIVLLAEAENTDGVVCSGLEEANAAAAAYATPEVVESSLLKVGIFDGTLHVTRGEHED